VAPPFPGLLTEVSPLFRVDRSRTIFLPYDFFLLHLRTRPSHTFCFMATFPTYPIDLLPCRAPIACRTCSSPLSAFSAPTPRPFCFCTPLLRFFTFPMDYEVKRGLFFSKPPPLLNLSTPFGARFNPVPLIVYFPLDFVDLLDREFFFVFRSYL